MPASVLKFTITVLGETLESAIQELESVSNQIILEQGGEPWVIVSDEFKKQGTSQEGLLSNAPGGSFYAGERTVLFTGPTKLADTVPFHDGYRPQQDEPGL